MLFSYFVYRRNIKFIIAFADSAMKTRYDRVFVFVVVVVVFLFSMYIHANWLFVYISSSSNITKQNFVWFIVKQSADIYFKQKRISIVKPLFLIEFPKTKKVIIQMP